MKLLSTITAVLISISAFSQNYVEYNEGAFLEEDYFYNAYYLVAKDGELIKLNKKNYLDQWEYLWKGCKAVDDFVNGKKNYDKIKKFSQFSSFIRL